MDFKENLSMECQAVTRGQTKARSDRHEAHSLFSQLFGESPQK